jgi:CHAT domain-containing protein/Tfp pilus assembly protein PilF
LAATRRREFISLRFKYRIKEVAEFSNILPGANFFHGGYHFYNRKDICFMSSAACRLFSLLALSLSLTGSSLLQAQSLPATLNSPQSSAESVVFAVVEKYFVLYVAKDINGILSLWSEKSPDYALLKQNLQRQFATEDYSVSTPVISRLKMESDKASFRTVTNLTAINPKNNLKREQRIVHNFAFVKEAEQWKIWRFATVEEDLAAALVQAKTEAERAELLAQEKEFVTVGLARALNTQGDRFANRGEYSKALLIYTLAKNLTEQIGDRYEIARTYHNLGQVHRSQGNFAQAMDYFQKSLAINQALGESTGIGRSLLGMGVVHWSKGDFTQALEHSRKSLTFFKAPDDNADIARVLNNLGNIHRSQGDYVQALDDYHKSLAIRQELNDTYGILSSLGNIGVVYGSQANFAKALEYYQKSLAMSEAENDKEGIAITLGNIGVLYRKQGNYEQALEYYQKSLAMSEAEDDKIGIAQMLNNIGTNYSQQRNYEEALNYYHKSLVMREKLKDKYGISHTMMAIGSTYSAQGNYAEAMQYFQNSLAIKEAIGDRQGVANLWLLIATYHHKQGHYAEALEFAECVATRSQQLSSPYLLWPARIIAGEAYRALNQLDNAHKAFEEAIAVIETLRDQVAGSGQEQQRFFENKFYPYHGMVDLFVSRNNPAEALLFSERAKARALLDMLYTSHVNIVKAMTSQEQAREQTLRTELNWLNTQVTRASQQNKPDQTRLNELNSLREKVRLNYEAFQTSLYAAHPELKVQRGEIQTIKAKELAALVPNSASALLEYMVTGDYTYLFVITKADGKTDAEVKVYTLPTKRDALSKQVEAYRQQIASRDLSFRASATDLYQLLLKPAQAQLQGKTNLVIVPDGTLWNLPFQTLLTGTNRYLIEDAAISYAPSLTVLREMTIRRKNRSADSTSTTLLALGNPLPGKASPDGTTLRDEKLAALPEAEQEVKALKQLYGTSRSKVYVGADAREDRVKTEAGQAKILHFAAHGMINNTSPMYSHLVLAEGGVNEDGLLEAWELMQMDLKADLAVLSACETARGRIGTGEGMIGLSWAMFVAGVPSIVVSQWKVESAGTRDLMVNFHRTLIAQPDGGKIKSTKANALRQAALKLMKNPETHHPFYWAGFVLVGDGR